MNMTYRKGDDLITIENRLPDMHVRWMRADKTRIGIIGHAYITRFVVIYHTNSAAIIEANKPCCTKFSGGGEGFSLRGRKPGGKIFGFLHKG